MSEQSASNVAIIFATFLGPVFAVWASEWRHNRRQAQEKRHRIFETLMSTRATRLNVSHIEALNQIDFAFQGSRYTDVREAWSLYRKTLQSPELQNQEETQKIWQSKANDLFSDLMHKMALSLKLPFPKSYISDNSYHPDAYLFAELDSIQIRQLLLQVLKDGRPINIREVDKQTTKKEKQNV